MGERETPQAEAVARLIEEWARGMCDALDLDPDESIGGQTNFGSDVLAWKFFANNLPAALRTPTAPVSDLRRDALPFCYAILGAATAQDAAAVWAANPEARAKAHRAIYESKPQDEPYDEMMARLRPERDGGDSGEVRR